jgi:hypothetical protein
VLIGEISNRWVCSEQIWRDKKFELCIEASPVIYVFERNLLWSFMHECETRNTEEAPS